MIAQAGDLIGERGRGDGLGFRRPVLPAFPRVAANPAGHYEKAHAIGFVEEFIAIGFAFEANGIQAHVLDVIQIGIQTLGGPAEKHVWSPGSAADQDVFAVDLEEPATVGGDFGGDFANTEGDVGAIRIRRRWRRRGISRCRDTARPSGRATRDEAATVSAAEIVRA